MGAAPLRLVVNQAAPKRACCTCRYCLGPRGLPECGASGRWIGGERMNGSVCGPEGKMWEPRPARRSFLKWARGLFRPTPPMMETGR